MGLEDEAVLAPAVEASRARGITIDGPLPADTVFVRAMRGDFDAVIACYHDQGLIPVKLVAFGQAVNVTLGLPIIRTSVDHGTAFDIAGRGVADPSSMVARGAARRAAGRAHMITRLAAAAVDHVLCRAGSRDPGARVGVLRRHRRQVRAGPVAGRPSLHQPRHSLPRCVPRPRPRVLSAAAAIRDDDRGNDSGHLSARVSRHSSHRGGRGWLPRPHRAFSSVGCGRARRVVCPGARRTTALAIVVAVGLGGPLWFYAVSGWEHAPAVAFGTAAFAWVLRSPTVSGAAP